MKSDRDDFAQFLDFADKDVAKLDDLLILRVFRIRSVRLDDPIDFIDHSMQSMRSNESAQIPFF